jgi:hypothetical protein
VQVVLHLSEDERGKIEMQGENLKRNQRDRMALASLPRGLRGVINLPGLSLKEAREKQTTLGRLSPIPNPRSPRLVKRVTFATAQIIYKRIALTTRLLWLW